MNIRTTLILSGVLLPMALEAASRLSQEELSQVDFVKECTTESNPLNRLLYGHEAVVNSFLNVLKKFGKERVPATHLSNAHLMTHGGTTTEPGGWSQGGVRYSISREWGLVGNVSKAESIVYYFDATNFMGDDGDPSAASTPRVHRGERQPDPFETYALAKLNKGEALVRWEREGFMRALGAIRAVSSCLKCHEGKEGDLLGAFTYEFEKSKAVEPDEKQPRQEERQQILQLSREGKSLEAIMRSLPGYAYTRGDYATQNVQWQLLDSGIVTDEMVEKQAFFRKVLTYGTLALERNQERSKLGVPSEEKRKQAKVSILDPSSFVLDPRSFIPRPSSLIPGPSPLILHP